MDVHNRESPRQNGPRLPKPTDAKTPSLKES